MTNIKKFRIHSIDEENWRVNFYTKTENNKTSFFCLQMIDRNNVEFFSCTDDGEPICRGILKMPAKELLELPEGDTEIEKMCLSWIEAN